MNLSKNGKIGRQMSENFVYRIEIQFQLQFFFILMSPLLKSHTTNLTPHISHNSHDVSRTSIPALGSPERSRRVEGLIFHLLHFTLRLIR